MNGPICIRCGQPIATMPIATPNGYQHERCPSRGMSTGLIIGLVGCGGLLLVMCGVFGALGVWQYMEKAEAAAAGVSASPSASAPSGDPTPITAPSEPLSQTFVTKNGLATLHYPSTFAASTPHDHVVLLQRRATSGDLVFAFDAIANPISTHLDEVDRVVRLETAKGYAGYVTGAVSESTCHGEKGIASGGNFDIAGVPYEQRACGFMKSGHYHRCSYVAPRSSLAEFEPLFHEMCAAVELKP